MLLTYLHMTGPGDSIPAESVYVSILHQLDAAEFTLCMSTKRRCLAEQSPWHMASGSQLNRCLRATGNGFRVGLQSWQTGSCRQASICPICSTRGSDSMVAWSLT